MKRKLLSILLILALALSLTFAVAEILVDGNFAMNEDTEVEYGYDYSAPEEVALYLHVFEELPPNYLTKDEARSYGWDNKKGNLWKVTDKMSIGGDRFGNREGLLPKAKGRQWYECDVNYSGGYRGSERILFSSDGMICYSGDHYKSYQELYDGWYNQDGYYHEH